MSACAHQDKASNATQAGATAAAPAGTVASSQPDPSQSLKDQIGTVIGQMDRDQNAAQQEQDDYNRALQDPTRAFSDATSAAVARAAADGDAAQVRRLVTQGARLDVHGVKNITLLEWEILHGSLPGVGTLLDAGADPSLRGVSGKTALSAAAEYGGPDYVRIFLNHHADPNTTDEDGNTPLIDAMINDDDAPMELLVRAGADVNRRGALRYTPLMAAALVDRYPRVLRLLQMGADPRATITLSGRAPATFQTYLNLAPRRNMNAEGKQRLDAIDDWLNAHDVPIEPPPQ